MANQMQYVQFLLLIVLVSPILAFDPYLFGPHWTTRLDVRRLTTVGLNQNLNVWSPTSPGNFPVLFFEDAFGAIIPGEAYNDTMAQVASHGYVVVASWRIMGSKNYTSKANDFQETIDWCHEHLLDKLHNHGVSTSMVIDYSLSFGMGHSAGSHILVEYLKAGCNDFKGIILSSPVDTPAPSNCITVGSPLNFEIPTLVLPAGLDNALGTLAPIPCAPDILSNARFWDALNPNSPRWLVNATEYGHGDYLNQKFLNIIIDTGFCAVKSDWTLEEFETYRSFVAGQIVSFLKSLVETDCETYLGYMENFASMPVETTGETIRVVTTCPRASCTWNPQ